jgi:hypothetical protein
MKVIFISGKYRGDIDTNIETAKKAAIKLWQAGYAVICPHLNTAHFDGLCPDSVWLAGDLEIMKRCDAIYLLSNWIESEGAIKEAEIARQMGLEIMSEAIDK